MSVNFSNLYPRPQVLALHNGNAFPYSETVQDKHYQKWLAKVKKRPDKITSRINQIYRVRVLNEGGEKILYNETLIGQDHNENELEFDHLVGKWEKPIFKKQYDEETDNVISQEINRHDTIYEIAYTPEKVIELASKGPVDTLSLVINTGSRKYGGVGIYSLEEFAYARFEALEEKGRTGKMIELEIPTNKTQTKAKA
jgi:hypothetical protein